MPSEDLGARPQEMGAPTERGGLCSGREQVTHRLSHSEDTRGQDPVWTGRCASLYVDRDPE